jgi:hypothetical protein
VDSIGRKILAANPQLAMQPQFRTIGAPQSEVFHRGTIEVDITEGLVKQCATDGQLAAVLCQELGKMVSERESLAGPQARLPERAPPMEVRIGSDNAGSFGPADQLYRAELAKYEKERPRVAATQLPDPQALGLAYLTKTGYPATDLDAVKPILATVPANSSLARQMSVPLQTNKE